jgi:hypothetical protein
MLIKLALRFILTFHEDPQDELYAFNHMTCAIALGIMDQRGFKT